MEHPSLQKRFLGLAMEHPSLQKSFLCLAMEHPSLQKRFLCLAMEHPSLQKRFLWARARVKSHWEWGGGGVGGCGGAGTGGWGRPVEREGAEGEVEGREGRPGTGALGPRVSFAAFKSSVPSFAFARSTRTATRAEAHRAGAGGRGCGGAGVRGGDGFDALGGGVRRPSGAVRIAVLGARGGARRASLAPGYMPSPLRGGEGSVGWSLCAWVGNTHPHLLEAAPQAVLSRSRERGPRRWRRGRRACRGCGNRRWRPIGWGRRRGRERGRLRPGRSRRRVCLRFVRRSGGRRRG